MRPHFEAVLERNPAWQGVEIQSITNGAIPHTPDDYPLVGPAGGLRNFWMCCGAAIGIAQGAGCGKYLAQWIIHGDADVNMASIDPRRYGKFANEVYTREKASDAYVQMYALHIPGEERQAGRPARTTPIYETLKAKGCIHTEAFGWERPKWFSLDGQDETLSFRRNNVFDVVAAECKAVSERVGVLELSSFAKFDVTGPDAESFLKWVVRQSHGEEGRRHQAGPPAGRHRPDPDRGDHYPHLERVLLHPDGIRLGGEGLRRPHPGRS